MLALLTLCGLAHYLVHIYFTCASLFKIKWKFWHKVFTTLRWNFIFHMEENMHHGLWDSRLFNNTSDDTLNIVPATTLLPWVVSLCSYMGTLETIISISIYDLVLDNEGVFILGNGYLSFFTSIGYVAQLHARWFSFVIIRALCHMSRSSSLWLLLSSKCASVFLKLSKKLWNLVAWDA